MDLFQSLRLVMQVRQQQLVAHILVQRIEIFSDFAPQLLVQAGPQSIVDNRDGFGNGQSFFWDVARLHVLDTHRHGNQCAIEQHHDELVRAGCQDARFDADPGICIGATFH